jgi:hypothetical protein
MRVTKLSPDGIVISKIKRTDHDLDTSQLNTSSFDDSITDSNSSISASLAYGTKSSKANQFISNTLGSIKKGSNKKKNRLTTSD